MESIRHGSMPLSDFYCKLMTDALGEQTPFPIDVKILSAKSTQTQSLLYQCSAIWVGSRYTVSSVTQLCLTLCDPMDCSTPGFPVHHQLPEPIQTHVHRIGDAIQPSHPLLSLLLLPSIFPSIMVFSNESALCIRWPKHWSFSFSINPSNEHSGLISFRMDWLNFLAVYHS